MQIQFYKYQGTGNDFVIIDNRTNFFDKKNTAFIRKICDRKFGIGADGLMLLELAKGYDFRMVYYNSDGNESTMCGNGGRCIAAFSKLLSITENKGNFIAIDGEHEFEITDNEIVKLKMIDVTSIKHFDDNQFELFTGSPHYVVFNNIIHNLDLVTEAKKIRYNDTYTKEGINVNYCYENDDLVYMRTYERGVEDETLSCGTGTVAVALCVAEKNNLQNGEIQLQAPGGKLKVHFTKEENNYTNIWLEASAKMVFEGYINSENI